MWHKKTILIFVVVLISLCSVSYALNFGHIPLSNGFYDYNFSLTKNTNNTVYIDIPEYAHVDKINYTLKIKTIIPEINKSASFLDALNTPLYNKSHFYNKSVDDNNRMNMFYDGSDYYSRMSLSTNIAAGLRATELVFNHTTINVSEIEYFSMIFNITQHDSIGTPAQFVFKICSNVTGTTLAGCSDVLEVCTWNGLECQAGYKVIINSSNDGVKNKICKTTYTTEGAYNANICDVMDVDGGYFSLGGGAGNDGDIYNVGFNNLNFTVLNYYPTNVSIYNNGTLSRKIDFNNSNQSITYNYDADFINAILKNQCYSGTILNNNCRYPLIFSADYDRIMGINNINILLSYNVSLIDEIDNTLFNIDNVTSARVYADDESSFFDFKTAATNHTLFNITSEKLRFEFIYSDGTVITRYIDLNLIKQDDLRVCINKEGTTHYEQLIQSSTEREALLRSIFADCYVAADYTRFGYETGYLLKAFTIATQYDLSVYDNGEEVRLSGIDGSLASYINLDTIEISQTEYNLEILGHDLFFSTLGNATLVIRYINQGDPNTAVSLSLYRVDIGALIYSTSTFTSLDDWTVYYDYTALSGINETSMFKAVVTRTNAGGTNTITRYTDVFARSGLIPAGIAIAAAFFMTIFGLTFTTARLSLSWFGIFTIIISLILLSVSTYAWYIPFFMFIDVIALIYCFIVMTMQNTKTLVN